MLCSACPEPGSLTCLETLHVGVNALIQSQGGWLAFTLAVEAVRTELQLRPPTIRTELKLCPYA
jgi:hypothetical protein